MQQQPGRGKDKDINVDIFLCIKTSYVLLKLSFFILKFNKLDIIYSCFYFVSLFDYFLHEVKGKVETTFL